jgi:phosphodiesterase/alkaline phosphatase D-like protein
MLRTDGIDNVVVLTGDLHSSWVCELTLGPADRQTPAGVEFVTPSITSDSFADMVIPSLPGSVPVVEALIRRVNRHVRWVDTRHHGYAVVDITPDRVQTDFWHVERIDVPGAAQRWGGGWTAQAGTAELRPAPAPAGK